ncbi:hypothetical protein V2J66_07320 [Pseudomonas alliivorans]|uniref:hypothetical protein n=1 Tax=Pseudomonas fragariae (ex Marin et al. 2024) TaxID=3080056 RepID=UPI002EBBDF7B|nr:hypothetical protein [Pseudomonas alliivorans]MEE5126122.1 hypothetical protein [Pseudomonas alliivorans]
MKNAIIRLNDYLCYLAIAIAAFAGYISFGEWGVIGGFVIGAVFAGFWLVLSGIHDELKKLTTGK